MSAEHKETNYHKRWLFLKAVIDDMKSELDSNNGSSNAVLARHIQLNRIIKAIEEAEKTY